MAAVTPPWAIQASSHPASAVRQSLQGIFGAPVSSFAGGIGAVSGGAHGVIGTTDLTVSANGTPNMTVNVAVGLCSIRGTENTLQGVYGPCLNDATLSVAISASDPTNPRKDLIVAKIRDAQFSGASNDFSIVVVTGTAAASPADPTIPANAVVLARVTVAAAATTITSGVITDLRTFSRSFLNAAVTPATVATAQGTTTTSYTDLATVGPTVTVTTGAAVLVTIGALFLSTSGQPTANMAFAVSGATTVAAADTQSAKWDLVGGSAAFSRTFYVSGLTPGSNVFTAKYKSNNAGATFTFSNRDLIVSLL